MHLMPGNLEALFLKVTHYNTTHICDIQMKSPLLAKNYNGFFVNDSN